MPSEGVCAHSRHTRGREGKHLPPHGCSGDVPAVSPAVPLALNGAPSVPAASRCVGDPPNSLSQPPRRQRPRGGEAVLSPELNPHAKSHGMLRSSEESWSSSTAPGITQRAGKGAGVLPGASLRLWRGISNARDQRRPRNGRSSRGTAGTGTPPLSPSHPDAALGWHFCLVPALLQVQDSRRSPVPPRPVTPRGSPALEGPPELRDPELRDPELRDSGRAGR